MIARTKLALATALSLALGCGGGDQGADDCSVSLLVTPAMPVAGAGGEITVTGSVANTIGVLDYSWMVSNAGTAIPFVAAASNGSAIKFTALDPGVYDVTLDVTAPSSFCSQASRRINVDAMGGNLVDVRLHVIPPNLSDAPPIDRIIRVHGGADYDLGPVVLDPGVLTSGMVHTATNAGVAAYLELIPQGMAGAPIETFSSATGAFDVRTLSQPHDVLVIPSSPALAPRRLAWSGLGSPSFVVDAGTTIRGVVRHGATAIAGAKVQLTIDGVPSTLGTTAGDGSFAVLGVPAAGAMVNLSVTPPASSGLPRIDTSAVFDLSQSIAVSYVGSLATRSLAGTTVRRAGSAVPNAKVTIVGTLSSVGTVTTGSVMKTASATLRVVAIADPGGALPAVLVPAGPLSAVVEVAPGDLAVAAFDTGSSVPALIDAPAMIVRATTAVGPSILDGARLDLVPTGSLALAGAPALQLAGDGAGTFTVSFPSGGLYDAYFSDPRGRAGRRVVLDLSSSTVGTSYLLDPAIAVTGTLSVTGSANKLRGASVQLLCATCTGVDRDRPIAEDASDLAGDFVLAVPDPGTM